MSNHLHQVRPGIFQVIINDTVAAILRRTSKVSVEIWILQDKPYLLATLTDNTLPGVLPCLPHVAKRIAEGEFDNDFRYEIDRNPEPDQPSEMYFVTRIATPSQKVLESFTTDDPGREVEAAREAQEYSLEERLGEYGLEWQREQEARGRS